MTFGKETWGTVGVPVRSRYDKTTQFFHTILDEAHLRGPCAQGYLNMFVLGLFAPVKGSYIAKTYWTVSVSFVGGLWERSVCVCVCVQ